METNINKMRRYILILMALAVVLLIFISAFANIRLAKATKSQDYMLNYNLNLIHNVHKMQSAFQTASKSLYRLSALYQVSIETDTEVVGVVQPIIDNIRMVQQISDEAMRFYYSEEAAKLLAEINEQSYRYLSIYQELIDAHLENDINKLYALFDEERIMSSVLLNRIQHLNDYLTAYTAEQAYASINSGRVSSVILIIATIAAFCIILGVGFATLSSLNKMDAYAPEPAPIYVQSPTATGNNNDALLNEFAKQIAELKIVAYDLSKITKERK